MKHLFLLLVAFLLFITPSYGQWVCPETWTANGCPSWTCPNNPDPANAPDSCAKVPYWEMGSFDLGGVWHYNPLYMEQMQAWGPNTPNTFPDAWKPYKGLIISGAATLQTHFRSDGNKATRVQFTNPDYSVSYPEVYRWLKSGQHQTFVASFTSSQIPGSSGRCQGPNGEPTWCTYPNTTMFYQGILPPEQIQQIYWVEKGLMSEPLVYSLQSQMSVIMDLGQMPSPNSNYSPIYGRYNFWYAPTFIGVWPKIMARWMDVVPEPNVETNIQITLISGEVFTLNFAGGDTENIPPMIPLKSVIVGQKTKVEQGKVKDQIVDVTVSNLLVSVENGNLVVSWTAPVISTPYMNLYVYVGSPWPPTGPLPTKAWYAWIEAMPQSSTVVLPQASWDTIKGVLAQEGFETAQVHLIYQHNYSKPGIPGSINPQGTIYNLRGLSDIVQIPLY